MQLLSENTVDRLRSAAYETRHVTRHPDRDLKGGKTEAKLIGSIASYFSVSLFLSPFFCLNPDR